MRTPVGHVFFDDFAVNQEPDEVRQPLGDAVLSLLAWEGVAGLDLNAWMLACESTGLDKAMAIDLFPVAEAGLMSAMLSEE
jgi:hypothetical protein